MTRNAMPELPGRSGAMDYGHSLEFGYFLIPEAGDPRGVLEAARLADSDEAIGRPPDHWTEVLTHLAVDLGFSTFVLMGKPDPQMLRTFIEDVAPRVRERVATARALPNRRSTPSPQYGEGYA